MKFLKDMECFFENRIEGFFHQYFTAEVQPAEIGKKIVRAMEENLQVSVTNTYAPNRYFVNLHPDDLARMQALEISLTKELVQFTAKQAEQRGYSLSSEPVVELKANEALKPGSMRVDVKFVTSDEQKIQGTQIFEGVKCVPKQLVRHKAVPCARIRVKEGADAGKTWELSSSRIYIGRRETNEIPLSDLNASRVHAYLQVDRGDYVLHDAKSLNGTYVNGERITHKVLEQGDSINIGHTTLIYEVI